MERRFWTAMILSIAVFYFFNTFILPQPTTDPEGDGSAQVDGSGETNGSGAGSEVGSDGAGGATSERPERRSPPVRRAPLVTHDFVSSQWNATFSSDSGGPQRLVLNDYTAPGESVWLGPWLRNRFIDGVEDEPFPTTCQETGQVNLVEDPEGGFLSFRRNADDTSFLEGGWEVVNRDAGSITYRAERGNLRVERRYEIPDEGYLMDYQVTLTNIGSSAMDLAPQLGVADRISRAELSGGRYGGRQRGLISSTGGVKRWNLRNLLRDGSAQRDGKVRWAGIDERYFLSVMIPRDFEVGSSFVEVRDEGVEAEEPEEGIDPRVEALLGLPATSLDPGASREFNLSLYMGPKEMSSLRTAGAGLPNAVDFGWFGIIAKPIHFILLLLHSLVGSYGISIILLTVLVKGALFPLNQRSGRSMKAMQALQPELKRINEKYADDAQAKNLATMELFKKHGVNPLGGCAPMLLQFPIWFALYRVLWSSIELYQTPFLYFCDLTLRDPIGIGPLILGGTMMLQQRVMPNSSTDPAQKQMMRLMPIFFTFIMFSLPAGLVLYIFVNTLLGILQQWYINKSFKKPAEAAAGA